MEDNYEEGKGEYADDRNYSCCGCTIRCGLVIFGMFLFVELFYQIYELGLIFINDKFNKTFGTVYTVFVIGLLVRCIF